MKGRSTFTQFFVVVRKINGFRSSVNKRRKERQQRLTLIRKHERNKRHEKYVESFLFVFMCG